MANELIDKKVTQDQADRMQAPMELDLTALFRVMENEMLKETESFEGTPEGLISELIRPLNNATGGPIARSKKKRDYKKEYEDFHGKPEQIENRAKRNKARAESTLEPGDAKEVDHIKPLAAGGSNSKENTRVVSRKTNREKGKKEIKKDGKEEVTGVIDKISDILEDMSDG